MMKTGLVVAFLVLSLILLIPGSNAGNEGLNALGGMKWGNFVPSAKRGIQQNWKIKFTNKKSSKTTHDTQHSSFQHEGQSGPARDYAANGGK